MPCCSRRLIVAIDTRQRRITSARDKKQSSIAFIRRLIRHRDKAVNHDLRFLHISLAIDKTTAALFQ